MLVVCAKIFNPPRYMIFGSENSAPPPPCIICFFLEGGGTFYGPLL